MYICMCMYICVYIYLFIPSPSASIQEWLYWMVLADKTLMLILVYSGMFKDIYSYIVFCGLWDWWNSDRVNSINGGGFVGVLQVDGWMCRKAIPVSCLVWSTLLWLTSYLCIKKWSCLKVCYTSCCGYFLLFYNKKVHSATVYGICKTNIRQPINVHFSEWYITEHI